MADGTPTIDSPEEAQSLARLISSGQLTGTGRDNAMSALRAYDATGAQPKAAAPSPTPAAPTPPAPGTPIPSAPRGHYAINHLGTPAEQTAGSALRSAIGTGEGILHGVTAPIGGAAGWLTGLLGAAGGSQSPTGSTGADLANELTGAQQAVSSALTYHPTTPVGQRLAGGIDRVLGVPGQLIQSVMANPVKSVLPASSGPGVDFAAQNFAPLALPLIPKAIKAAGPALGRIGAAPVQPWDTSTGAPPPLPPRPRAAPAQTPAPAAATGTAATGFGADTASAARSPPIGPQNPQALNDAMAAAARGRNGENQPNNGLNNATAIDRHTRAASLPVPVTLTEAAATGDPTVFTLQKELQSQAARAGDTRLVDRVVENNNQLVGNLRALRSGAQAEGTGSEVAVPASDADKGDTLMQLAQNRAATVRAATTAAYDELRAEANRLGPDTKVYDANGPLQQAQALLTTNLRRKVTENTPALSGLMQDLQDAAEGGGFTADAYLTTRRDAMNLARTASDGWVRQAAGNITQALDNAELMPGAEQLRALDQRARGMFRQEREIEEADPLYAAATSGDPAMTGQKFMNRFITGTAATRDGITRFLQTLGDDTPARQIIATSFADSLRDAAKINPDGRGVFRQAPYNAQLKKLSDRIHAVSPNMGTLAQAIGDTARDVGEFPAGEVSSKSNSSDWLRGVLMDHATSLVPGGKLVQGAVQLGKGILDRGKMTRAVDRAVAPYAGLGRTDLAQPVIPEPESVPDFFPRQTAAAAAQPPPTKGAPTPQMSPNRPGGGSPGSVPPPPRPGPGAAPPPPPPRPAPTPASSAAPTLPPRPPVTPQSAPTMTGEQAQNIVAGMPPQWRQAAIKSITDAHRMLSREQGAGTVSISDLQQRTGIPLPQLHALLLSQSRLGRLSLTGQTSAEASAQVANGAGVTVPGVSGPRVAVTMPPLPPRSNAAMSAITHSVQDERGQPLQVFTSPSGGQLRAYVDGQHLKVKDVGIDQQHRGKGEGIAMYEEANRWAQQHGLTLASDYTVSADAAHVWDALSRRGHNVVRNPDAMSNGGIVYHGMRQPVFELRGGSPTAPVHVGAQPPPLPPGRIAGGSPIPSAPSSVTPANIIDAMRQVQPRVEEGLSVKILDLARQLGVTPHELAKHLEPLGRQAILDLHTHPWPDRLTEAEKAQLPSDGMGGWWDAVTIRRGAKMPGGTTQ